MSLPDAKVLFRPVKPKAAIAYWKQKSAVTKAEAESWEEKARHRAFYVAGLTRHDQIQTVMRALGAAIEHGESLSSFKARIHDVIQSQGWQSHRIKNIFRTNIQTAYAAGRYSKMMQVAEDRPYWQYLTVGDERTRPAHAALDEEVRRFDDGFWAENYPPNGFRCRCTVRTLSDRQVKSLGLTPKKGLPGPTVWTDPKSGMEYFVQPGADKGFNGNPGRDWMAGLSARRLEPELFNVPANYPKLYTTQDNIKISDIPEKHILPVGNMLLPSGLAAEEYAKAFLREFGIADLDGEKIVKLPGVRMPLLINKQLLLDKRKNSLKTTKNGRGEYMKLLAQTIKDPYEVWLLPAHIFDRDYPMIRLVRLFQGQDRKIGGFSVFNYAGGKYWSGSTVFEPGKDGEISMINYLNLQRTGYLLFQKK